MTTRRLDRHSRIKPTIAFFSHKMRRHLFCEGTVEQNALYAHEYDRSVIRYNTQPRSVDYRFRGRGKRRYTPDTLVERRGPEADRTVYEYEEIKSAGEAEKPEFRAKFLFLQDYFAREIGIPLLLRIGESPTNPSVLLCNQKFFYPYLGLPLDRELLNELRGVGSRITYINAVQWMESQRRDVRRLLTLIAHGELTFDWSQMQLQEQTILEVSPHEQTSEVVQ